MELREYWNIVARRWWLVVLVVLGVAVVSAVTYHPPPEAYAASMRFAIGIEGEEAVLAPSGEGRSDAWLASEYLADDLSEVLKGGTFAAHISESVGFPVPAGTIFASREHRIMSVYVSWGKVAELQAIAEAVAAAVEDGGAAYFPQLDDVNATAVLIDGPAIGPVGRSLMEKLDLPIRLFVALVAGVALTFLWDYLDDAIRTADEVEALGLSVLAEIPRVGNGRLWTGRER
jgi:capsular polysaccharide biosynthesis protein